MSRKGWSPDNAACEGFVGRLESELFCSKNRMSTTVEEFDAAVDPYIRWYNDGRTPASEKDRASPAPLPCQAARANLSSETANCATVGTSFAIVFALLRDATLRS